MHDRKENDDPTPRHKQKLSQHMRKFIPTYMHACIQTYINLQISVLAVHVFRCGLPTFLKVNATPASSQQVHNNRHALIPTAGK